jgi:hypothetical protein
MGFGQSLRACEGADNEPALVDLEGFFRRHSVLEFVGLAAPMPAASLMLPNRTT